MSWSALPYWVYEDMVEMHYAKMSCAFDDEWFSATSKALPHSVHQLFKGSYELDRRA